MDVCRRGVGTRGHLRPISIELQREKFNKLRKYAFKFNRQIEGTEDCDATVLADDQESALNKFNNQEWSTFLISRRDVRMDMDNIIISEFKEIGVA